MANTVRKIRAAVGIRNGQSIMPNEPEDLTVITELFDRIKSSQGGSAEIGGVWVTERTLLISEVTAQIIAFQTVNRQSTIDGVVDPSGGTLRLMNQLAADASPTPSGGITATVVDAPAGFDGPAARSAYVADVSLMPGTKPLRPTIVSSESIRLLVRVEGSSIKWFGVVLPQASQAAGTIPHLNFTPTPIQGHYYDATYDTFGGWGQLWDDYTEVIGGQMVASGANQVLVLPFYKTSQQRNLGLFLDNWQEVVSAVVTEAMNSIDPYRLRDKFSFSRIVSSSFSNGYVAHQGFNGTATGAAAMTDVIIDLDGQAGGSTWRPSNGIIYLNRPSPGANPMGNNWYVGGRWGKEFQVKYGAAMNTHACCRNHLLYHALWLSNP